MTRTSERAAETVVARDAEIRGKIEGNEDLRVFGLVEGSIELSARLIVEERGLVQADVKASEIHVAGFVQGNLQAATVIMLGETARVQGDLFSPRLHIAPGARVDGAVRTGAAASEVTARPPAKAKPIFLGRDLESAGASETPTAVGGPESVPGESRPRKKPKLVVKVRRGRQSEVEGG